MNTHTESAAPRRARDALARSQGARPAAVPGGPRGRRALARRSSKREGAFTLIEMLAVLSVVGIMVAVAVVGFSASGRGARLRGAARMISQHLTYARQLAMTRRAQYGVEFDTGVQPPRFRVCYEDASSNKVTVGQWADVPLGVALNAPDEINFTPTGRAVGTPADITVVDSETGKSRTIHVVPVTGHNTY